MTIDFRELQRNALANPLTRAHALNKNHYAMVDSVTSLALSVNL